MISLYDTLRIHGITEKKCLIEGCNGIPLQENLMWKAYQRYCGAAEEYCGIQVACKKSIPAMAGLGGGSSDAAAMLRLLRKFHPVDIGENKTLEIASELGSDVPFFLKAPAALMEGRGDIIGPVQAPPESSEWSCVLIKPDFDVSTGEAYAQLDECPHKKYRSLSIKEIQEQFQAPPGRWRYFNSFTPVLLKKFPRLEHFMQLMDDCGAEYYNVSGSGSALFGVFRDKEGAEKSYLKAKKSIKKVWKVKMLASLTEAVYN